MQQRRRNGGIRGLQSELVWSGQALRAKNAKVSQLVFAVFETGSIALAAALVTAWISAMLDAVIIISTTITLTTLISGRL
jgi:hypothetical protein